MQRVRGLISVMRLEDCLISAVAVWIGWLAASRHWVPQNPIPLVLWCLSTFLLVGALNILNDMGDLEIDRLIHGKRALASGKISLRLTERYLLFIAAGSVVLAFAGALLGGGILTFLLYLVGFGIALLYEIWLKKRGFTGNIAVAVLVSFPFLLGGSIFGIGPLVVTLVVMAFFTGLAKEIINDVKDMDGDRGKRRTLPFTIGVRSTLRIAVLLLTTTIVLSFIPLFIIGPEVLYMVFMGFTDTILVIVMFTCFRRPNLAHHLQSLAMAVSLPGIISISVLGW